MKLHKTFKFRIYPTGDQLVKINKTLGTCRFCYNQLLAAAQEEYETITPMSEQKPNISTFELARQIRQLKKQKEWICETGANILNFSIADRLSKAYTNFFRKVKAGEKTRLRFKSKHNSVDSFTDYLGKVKGNKIQIIGFKEGITFSDKRTIPESYTIKSTTITKCSTGKYYASLMCEYEVPDSEVSQDEPIGLDMGLKDFITMSTGEKIESGNEYRKKERQLKRYNRSMSRKKKAAEKENRKLSECKNYQKAKLKSARAHEKVKNLRKGYIEKAVHKIINET